ncbi:MAG TPA: hypothetical protein VGC08_06525, partial [Pedobacter sp.]
MTRQEFLYLYEKSLRGACSASEEEQLAFYQDEMKLSSGLWEDPDTAEQEVGDRIWNKLRESRYPSRLPFSFTPARAVTAIWIRAAAAVLIFSAALWIFKKPEKPQPGQTAPSIAKKHTPVLPGGNKAYLTLADGSKIILNDARIGKLATQAGIQVTKAKDGILIYRFKDKKTTHTDSPDNTITTP